MIGLILMETKRLRFRLWADSDAEALYKYASDPDVGPRAGWPPHQSIQESLKVIRDYFSNGHTWALELKKTGEAIGCMGQIVRTKRGISALIASSRSFSFDVSISR